MDPKTIKRALMCCVYSQPCTICSHDNFYCIHGYRTIGDRVLLSDALVLINKYEAEIDLLKAQIAVYEGWVNKC